LTAFLVNADERWWQSTLRRRLPQRQVQVAELRRGLDVLVLNRQIATMSPRRTPSRMAGGADAPTSCAWPGASSAFFRAGEGNTLDKITLRQEKNNQQRCYKGGAALITSCQGMGVSCWLSRVAT